MKKTTTHPPGLLAWQASPASGRFSSLLRRCLMLCLLFTAALSKQANATLVSIGSAYTTASYYVGVYAYYGYGHAESIYKASEIGTGGNITSLAINKAYGSSTTDIDSVYIYMKETSATTVSTSVSLSGYTQVFKGSLPNSMSSGWATATFPTSFAYTGSNNLSVIIMRHGGTAMSSGIPEYYCSYDGSGTYAMAYNNWYSSDYWSGWAGATASASQSTYNYYRACIQLDITAFAACTGTPTAGTAVASTTTACPGIPVKFSLSGSSLASSITYTWDTSATGTAGSFVAAGTSTSVGGAWSFTPPKGRTLYYRCRAVCSAGGSTATSTTISVTSSGSGLPYTEDFESTSTGSFPNCATASLIRSTYDGFYVKSSASYPSWLTNNTPLGSKYLFAGYYVGVWDGTADYFFTPQFDLSTGKTYRFSYWYNTDGYGPYTVGAGIGTSQTKSAMSSIGPDMSVNNTTYAQYVTNFTVSTTGSYYLGLKNKQGSYYYGCSFDDIGLMELPDCNTATASTFASGGKASASPTVLCSTPGTVSLSLASPAFSGLTFSWEVVSGSPSFPATPTVAGTTSSASYSIPSGGTYYFRCKVTCSSTGTFKYSDTVKVTTAPITPPYVEDFEGASVPSNVPCAGYTYSWSSPGYYWSTANAGSPGSTVVNHTTGGSKVLLAGGYLGMVSGNTEWWFTPSLALTAGKAYDVSFWFRSANSYSGYGTYDVTLGLGYGSSQSASAMTSLGDTVTQPSGTSSSWFQFKRGFVSSVTGAQYIGIKVNHSYYQYYGTNIDDIGVVQLPPCSAKPVAGKAVAKPAMICSTGSTTVTLLGTSAASDLTFAWQQSSTGLPGSWSAASGGSGAATPGYTTPTLTTGPMYYRCVIVCGLIAAPNADTSVPVKVNVGPITPPYIEDFETATPGINQPCASYTGSFEGTGTSYYQYWGIKGSPGVSYPSVKNRTTGGSKYLSAGYYVGTYGLGTPSGLQQYWFSPALALTGGMAYKCNYWYVTSGYTAGLGGTTFGLYYGTSQSASAMTAMRPDVSDENNTTFKEIVGAFNAPTTGNYYLGVKVSNGYGYYGIAVDDIGVYELPLCAAKPTAGTVTASPSLICSSGTAVLSLSGSSMASKLEFQWEESTTGATGPWAPVASGSGGTTSSYTSATLSATRWYRCIVKCPLIAAPNADTTAVYTMNVGAIIPPYMETFEASTPGVNVPCAGATNWSSYAWMTTSGTTSTYGYTDLINHTAGGNKWLKAGYGTTLYSGGKDYWFTPAIKLTGGATYEFSYWYLPDGYSGSGVSNQLGAYVGTSQSASAMTALTPDFYPSNSTYKKVEANYTPTTTGNYYFGIYASGSYAYGQAIDDIGVIQLPPCAGKPSSGGFAAVAPAMLCSSGTAKLNLSSTPKVANLSYQWYECTAAGVLGTAISGVLSSPSFTTPTVTSSRYYRCIVRCTLGSATDTTYSSITKLDVGAIDPPYIETFETGTPGVNMPCASNTWYFGTSYYWNVQGSPVSSGSYGVLDNHTTGGSKYLIAGYYVGYTGYGSAAEEWWFTPAIKFTSGKLYQLSYWFQTDGYSGTTYTVGTYMGNAQTRAAMTTAIGSLVTSTSTMYKYVKNQFTATATGNFYIGFRKSASSFGYGVAIDDIGLEEVPPCSAPVVAGTIAADPIHVCTVGGSSMLDLTGSTLATGLSYEWLSSLSETGPYTLTGGTGLPYSTDPLLAPTWFRAIIKCAASGARDTSAPFKVGVGGFDLPYSEDFESTMVNGVPLCSDATMWGSGFYSYWAVCGSTLTGAMSNHTPGGKKWLLGGYLLGSPAAPTEDNYWFTPGLNFRAGYKYNLSFYYVGTYTTSYPNKMGVYMGRTQTAGSMTTVLAPYRTVTNTSYSLFDTTFKTTAGGVYYVGFRKSGSNPSGTYSYYGTAFDDINLNYAPCDGLPFSGNIRSTSTSGTGMCKGTFMKLVDTGATISLVPGIKYQWQRKAVGSTPSPLTWTAVPGAIDTILAADTLVGYEYRLGVICGNTHDTAFSTSFKIPALPPHPTVSISPATTPINYCLGDTVKFAATNFTGAVYDWMVDSVVIPGWKFSDLGATEPGVYMVKVSSALSPCPGWSNKVTMVVNDPGYKVTITKPADSILCAGTTVILTAVSSKPGVTYQWRKNNVDIAGATSSSYGVTTTGYYRVMVSDGISTCPAASRSVLMTVKPNPPAVISVPGGTTTACENEGVILNANTGGFSYEWMRAGSTVVGWTDSTLLVKNSGVYSVKVRSADGCVNTSADITVNILPAPTPVITKTGSGTSTVLSTGTGYVSWQWYRNGLPIPGATTFEINTVKLNGLYTVKVTGANNCEGESTPVEVNELGLSIGNTSYANDQIKIYPNPTQSIVNIESPIEVQVSVKDVTGKTVYEAKLTKQVDLSKFADGVYMFTISDKEGNELIKQQRVTKFTSK